LFLNATMPGLLLLMVVGGATLITVPYKLSELLYGDRSFVLAAITVLAFFVAYTTRFLSLILRMEDRGFAYSMSQVLAKLLLVIIVIVLAFTVTHRELYMLFSAQLGAWGIALLVFSWNTRTEWLQSFRMRIESAEVKKLLR